ncbi:MAG TPA: PKD domain-containing protein, partial [Firmicutes bacterium]|nr:PKD domain-containing protein [Bacillota bacterium]
VYMEAGEYHVDLRVCDTPGLCSTLDEKLIIQVLQEGNTPPVAVATADKLFGYEGDFILFDGSGSYDLEDGSPTSWGWDMNNNGQYNDSPFVVHSWQFNTEGIYPIDLKVTDKDGAWDTLDEKIVITIVPVGSNFPPFADGEVNCAFPVEGQKIKFTSQSYDLDGEIVKWEWDFYEGEGWEDFSSTEGEAEYIYEDEGIYWVNHRVTDDGGMTVEIDNPIMIIVTQPSFEPPTELPSCSGANATHFYAASGVFSTPNTTVTSRDLAFLGDGQYLAVVGGSLVKCFPPATISPPPLLYGADWVQSIDTSRTDLVALSGLSSGVVRIYSLSGGIDLVKQFNSGFPISAITFDADENLWIYGDGILMMYAYPNFASNPCSMYEIPELETFGAVQDMVWSAWNHSFYFVINDGAGGTVVEVDHLGNIVRTVSNVLQAPSNYMDIVIDNNVSNYDSTACRIQVVGGIHRTYITRLDAHLNIKAQAVYGFWGARAAALSPAPGNEMVILEDCCISWVDLLIPPTDWTDTGGGG